MLVRERTRVSNKFSVQMPSLLRVNGIPPGRATCRF